MEYKTRVSKNVIFDPDFVVKRERYAPPCEKEVFVYEYLRSPFRVHRQKNRQRFIAHGFAKLDYPRRFLNVLHYLFTIPLG